MFDDWVEHGMLRVDGSSSLLPFEMRFVRRNELDALFQMHHVILKYLAHPHQFRPDSREFMAKHIDVRGRTVGVFVDNELVAYAAISFPDGDSDNLGRDLPLPPEEFAHIADYDGSAVHPRFRGNGLQKKMTVMRHRYALAHDRYHILGTVSPLNAFSLSNFLNIGCLVKNIKTKYGGMTRLIIHMDLRDKQPTAFVDDSLCDVELIDVEQITALLRNKFQGFRVVINNDHPRLYMGIPLSGAAGAASPISSPLPDWRPPPPKTNLCHGEQDIGSWAR